MNKIVSFFFFSWGVVLIICLGLYGQYEIDNNITHVTVHNDTSTYYTGKEIVAQNALIIGCVFLAMMLTLFKADCSGNESNCKIASTAISLVTILFSLIVSYVLSVVIFDEMCSQKRCFHAYTPLYWLTWIILTLGTIAMASMACFIIIALIVKCCPCWCDPMINKCCEKCDYWCGGILPKWQQAEPVEVERKNLPVVVEVVRTPPVQTEQVQPVVFHYSAQNDPLKDGVSSSFPLEN